MRLRTPDLDERFGSWWSSLPTWAGVLMYLGILAAIVTTIALFTSLIR